MSPILQELKAYFKTKIDLIKFESLDTASAIIAELAVELLIGFCILQAFIFFTVALAFYLSQVSKSAWAGFGMVTLLYITIIIFSHVLKSPLQNGLIRVIISKTLKKRS